jgi:hypothetical protein
MKCPLTPSDLIEIIGILTSLITSIIAIGLSIKTLMQNSKMIESSTRPYIGVYLASTYIRNISCYLVVKNFGQSSATINSFAYDYDLALCSKSHLEDRAPFQNIEGSTLMPGQAHRCIIDLNKAIQQVNKINFHVIYSSGTRKYEDNICVNLIATVGNFTAHNTTKDKELEIVSETLQDMYISSL